MNDPDWGFRAASKMARALIHEAEEAAFGSLNGDGSPLVSHVPVATMVDGAPLVLISQLAMHTKNIGRDERASLLFVGAPHGEGDPSTRPRISVQGRLVAVHDRDAARERYLRRQPAAVLYADFDDFAFMRLEPAGAHLVAGFGRIVDLEPAAFLASAADTAAVAAMEAGAAAHMDDDHADAMALMANVLAGEPGGPWRAVGIDPLGIDLGCGNRVLRVEFDEPATDGTKVRMALVALTKRARARLAEAPGA